MNKAVKTRDLVARPQIETAPPEIAPADDTQLAELVAGLLDEGLGVRFCAKGWSMHPTIRDGEPITVEAIAAAAVKRGDVVLCRSDSRLVAHRVVGVMAQNGEPLVLVLRGDASRACDELFRPEQVLGRVVAVEREGRTIALHSWQARLAYTLRACFPRLAAWRDRFDLKTPSTTRQ